MAFCANPEGEHATAGRMRMRIFLICALQFVLFFLVAYSRPVDVDEGYYLTAARLVSEGRFPSIDFFYTQMPLLPYCYAIWMQVAGFSFIGGRLLSVLCGVGTTALLASFAYRKTKDMFFPVIIAVLFICNGQVISWFTVAKTYAVTSLCLAGAVVLLAAPGRRNAFFVGMLSGMAVNMRLLLLPLALALLLWTCVPWRDEGWRPAARRGLLYLAGCVPPSALSVYLFFRDPGAFVFTTIGYHLQYGLYFGGTALRTLLCKMQAFFHVVRNPQTLLLLIAAIGTGLLAHDAARQKRPVVEYRDDILLFLALAAAAAGSALPRADDQYYVICVPFLVFLCVSFGRAVIRDTQGMLRRLYPALIVLYLAVAVPCTGLLSTVFDPAYGMWRMKSVEMVAQKIRELSREGEAVLSFWPGYTFLAGRDNLAGMENEFAYLYVPGTIPEEAMVRYGIITDARLREAIRDGIPALIVWDWGFHPSFATDKKMTDLKECMTGRYELAATVGQAALYRKSGGPVRKEATKGQEI